MRIENWNPNVMDQEFEGVAIERLVEAAEVVANSARLKCPVGSVTRPMYKKGKYAGMPWTSRDAGRLRASIRVVRKRGKEGIALSRKRDVRIYAGHYLAWYAKIVEFYKPYLRPALWDSLSQIRSILGVR
jgi:hypothetical protein